MSTDTNTAALQLPAEDRTLSPHTGYTRDHWEAAADGLLANAWKWTSPRGARLDMPGPSSGSGVRSDGLEGYARTFLAAGFRVAGANGDDPHNWIERYAAGIVAGTEHIGADDAESWPPIRDIDQGGQPMVESASVALGLRLTRPWLWENFNAGEQDRIEEWLRGALYSVPAPNNWYLFPFTVAGFLESVGRGDEQTSYIRQRGLDLLDSWYLGQGWYTDGEAGGIDYYNGWALHFYPVLDQLIASREAGHDPSSVSSQYTERLTQHLQSFSHFFAANGAPVHHGRSLTYRFAATAAVGLGAIIGATPLEAGASRRVISGSLRYFLERGAINSHGLLSLGWHQEHAPTCQVYSGPASPYWASKGFVSLLAGADHPLWTQHETLSPVEEEDHVVAIEPAGLLVQSTQDDGVVRLHNHALMMERPVMAQNIIADALYNRWAYSTHTGPTGAENQPENDFAVFSRGRRGSRLRTYSIGAQAHGDWGWIASWHKPIFKQGMPIVPGLSVLSLVIAHGSHELRVHQVTGAPDGASVESTGWATAHPHAAQGEHVTSQLVPLSGWEDQDVVTAPAGTAYVPIAEVSRLQAPVHREGVYVSLASLVGEASDSRTPDAHDVVKDLSVESDGLIFRWADHSNPIRVGFGQQHEELTVTQE